MSDLRTLQTWLQEVITHPGGVDRGVAAASRADPEVPAVKQASVVRPPSALSAAEGLAIYGTAYRLRLLECLRAEYPCLLHAVGEDLFRRFASDYLDRHPPRTYTLNRLAESLPDYLAETRPATDPATGKRESWPDFLIDLASLERAFVEVYHGPGNEGQPLPTAGDVERLTPAQLSSARFFAAASLRLLAFTYPVHEYFRAVRRKQHPHFPAPDATYLALVRVAYRVHIHRLSRQELEFLKALIRGPSPDAVTSGDAGCLSQAEMGRVLSDWAEKGFFGRVD